MEGIIRDLRNATRRRHVIRKTSNGLGSTTSATNVLPNTKDADKEVSAVTSVQQLGEEVEVGYQGGLEDDGDVGGVEELNGVAVRLAASLLCVELEFNFETLKVNDHDEHQDSGEEVGQVR